MQQAWVERLNQSEAEKDDMKQAIEMLIKKGAYCRSDNCCLEFTYNVILSLFVPQVERTNGDYRDWPRAKMYLPAPVGKRPLATA